MPLTMRPTRLGAGIDKDRQDFTIYSGDGRSAGSMRRAVVPITLRWFWSFTITCPMTRSDQGGDLGGGQGAVPEELGRLEGVGGAAGGHVVPMPPRPLVGH